MKRRALHGKLKNDINCLPILLRCHSKGRQEIFVSRGRYILDDFTNRSLNLTQHSNINAPLKHSVIATTAYICTISFCELFFFKVENGQNCII